MTVTVKDAARREELQERVTKIEQVDRGLRTSFSGFEADSIVAEARTSLSQVGVEMSEDDLRAYARSIAERSDFEYVLA